MITGLYGSWTATPFGNPRLERSDRHLIIDSRSDTQAGLIVARDLDPDFMQLCQDQLAEIGFSRGDDLFMNLLSNGVSDIGAQIRPQ